MLKESPCRQRGLNSEPLGYNDFELATLSTAPARHNKLGIWLHSLLLNRSQFVRIPGGFSTDSQVISGVPQGTVLGPLLFLVLMSDINKGVSNTKIISFADDTRVYNNINTVDDCNVLQSDLESVCNWADVNNMLFNAGKFDYLSFACKSNSLSSNVYVNPDLNIINQHDSIHHCIAV